MSRRGNPTQGGGGWAAVYALVRPFRRRVVALALGSFARGLLEAVFLVAVTRLALAIADGRDRVGIIAGRSMSVEMALGLATLLLVARLGISLGTNLLANRLTVDVGSALRKRLARSFLSTSWDVLNENPSGQLQLLLTNFAQSGAGVVSSFTTSMVASLSLTALILGAFAIDLYATLAVIVALVVLGSVLAPLRRRIRYRAGRMTEALATFGGSIEELGSLGLEMKTFGVREQFERSIDDHTDQLAKAQLRTENLRGSLVPVYTTLAYGAIVAGLASAAVIGVGKLTSLGAVMLIMLRSLAYGQQLQQASGSMLNALPALERVDSAVETYLAHPAPVGSEVPPDTFGIEARDVGYTYPDGHNALHDLSFRIESGETVGIIGPSGAGKSTLVELLLGVRDPSDGHLRVGGVDLRRVDRAWWARHVAFVAQDAVLLTGTVRDNIRFFRQFVTDADIERAAQLANLTAEISALPHGFDTDLGERASRLSGGQRQRLSIARALAGSPQLLVLDEPTSALDVRSESMIRNTIAGWHHKTTTIIIAHRLSTLDVCDRLMVIDGGQLVAFDDPATLRRSNDFFRHALDLSGLQ